MDIERIKLLIIENLKMATVAFILIGMLMVFILLVIGVFYYGWFLFNEAPGELQRFALCTIGVCVIGYILYAFFRWVDE